MRLKEAFRIFPFEAACWLLALAGLAFHDPYVNEHFTVCPLALAGFDWCPGCGLGRSISLFLRGSFKHSFAMHPLGFFAILVLSFRIFHLTKTFIKTHGTRN